LPIKKSIIAFASKVMGHSGSALPPELASRRWLSPAGSGQINSGGYAPRLGFALIIRAIGPHQGHSPGIIWLVPAGQSHRLTSGGKADTRTSDFWGSQHHRKRTYAEEYAMFVKRYGAWNGGLRETIKMVRQTVARP